MFKVRRSVITLSLALVAAAGAMPGVARANAGMAAGATCNTSSAQPAMLVRVTGFKDRTGTIRVQSYGGDPSRFFDKGSYLKRIEVRVPASGPLDVCMPVPGPGTYAVAVYHLDPSGEKEGGGTSGNPETSLWNLMLRRKPAVDKVAVPVGRGVRVVPIVLNYRDGMSFHPVAMASR
jgi:uncharacterized protein (DUF2141 family)